MGVSDKVKTLFMWVLTVMANWLAWFELNVDLIAKVLAVLGGCATIILTIFHALTLREKFRYYKNKNIKHRNGEDI